MKFLSPEKVWSMGMPPGSMHYTTIHSISTHTLYNHISLDVAFFIIRFFRTCLFTECQLCTWHAESVA